MLLVLFNEIVVCDLDTTNDRYVCQGNMKLS